MPPSSLIARLMIDAGRRVRRSGRPRHLRVGAALAAVLLAGIAVTQSGAIGAVQPHAAKLSPPVVNERFDPLPCPNPANASTTLEMKGCAQREIARTDVKIDRVARAIFSRLRNDAARRRFIKAQRAWLAYRAADCSSVSDKFQGGTLAPVTALQCSAQRTTQHLREIRAFDSLLRREG